MSNLLQSIREAVKTRVWRFLLKRLTHTTRTTAGGAQVIVLRSGAIIDAESEAMIQAMHSRSPGGLFQHLVALMRSGPGKFMETFYVGYSHKSIGDCGSGTVFIEGVSMLVAKAIQDTRLYSGQEVSTRYVDFSVQPFIDPIRTTTSEWVFTNWRNFYVHNMPAVVEHLKQRFPRQPGEKNKIYDKAIAARAFDTMRGFLPAGASTNLAWHSNLRQFADHLMLLRHHPLEEVREVAEAIEEALKESYPSSFGHKRYEGTEEYNRWWMENEYMFRPNNWTEFAFFLDRFNEEMLGKHRSTLSKRPPKTDLPKKLATCGVIEFDFMLDFGSFRDIQRHRAVTQQMPMLTEQLGFEPWYLDELPDSVRIEALTLLRVQSELTSEFCLSEELRQYYLPMGYRVPMQVVGDLPALVYLVELRATRFVHPTLCHRAIQMAEVLMKHLGPLGLVLHLDDEPGRFDIRRGDHDIIQKM